MNEKYKDKIKRDIEFERTLRTHSVLGELEYPNQKERDLEEELYQIERAEKRERNKHCRNFSVEVDGY
jgi:hypothetical protein